MGPHVAHDLDRWAQIADGSADFAVHSVTYPYDQSIDAGSDHSAVVTDISLRDL